MHLLQEAFLRAVIAQPFPANAGTICCECSKASCPLIGRSIIGSFHKFFVRSSSISHKFAALLVAYGNIKISFQSKYLTSLGLWTWWQPPLELDLFGSAKMMCCLSVLRWLVKRFPSCWANWTRPASILIWVFRCISFLHVPCALGW